MTNFNVTAGAPRLYQVPFGSIGKRENVTVSINGETVDGPPMSVAKGFLQLNFNSVAIHAIAPDTAGESDDDASEITPPATDAEESAAVRASTPSPVHLLLGVMVVMLYGSSSSH